MGWCVTSETLIQVMWKNSFQSRHLLPNKAALWQVVMWQHYCGIKPNCLEHWSAQEVQQLFWQHAIMKFAYCAGYLYPRETAPQTISLRMWTGFISMMTCALHAAAKAACSFTQRADKPYLSEAAVQ